MLLGIVAYCKRNFWTVFISSFLEQQPFSTKASYTTYDHPCEQSAHACKSV